MKTLRNPSRRPTHPGAILREDVLPALEMTQTEFAERLGVSRLSVSDLLHGKRAMTPEMAARVAKLLNTTPESWLRMQEAVDLWEVQQHAWRPDVSRPWGGSSGRGAAESSNTPWRTPDLCNYSTPSASTSPAANENT